MSDIRQLRMLEIFVGLSSLVSFIVYNSHIHLLVHVFHLCVIICVHPFQNTFVLESYMPLIEVIEYLVRLTLVFYAYMYVL